jgi:hypothetical protein
MNVGVSKCEAHGGPTHVEAPYTRALRARNPNRVVPALFQASAPMLAYSGANGPSIPIETDPLVRLNWTPDSGVLDPPTRGVRGWR